MPYIQFSGINAKIFKSIYAEPKILREIINDSNFAIEDVKTKKKQQTRTIDSIVLTFEVLLMIKKTKMTKT